MGWFSRKPKLRERVIRADYRRLPEAEWTDDEYDHFVSHCTDEEYWEHWERWSRDAEPHPTVQSIRRPVLQMAAEAAKASYPQEFASGMRVEKGVVTELVFIPGTVQGDRHALMPFYQLPVDRSIKGTLHSHPSPHPYPSDADFELFEKHGTIHIIYGNPYGPDDWRAYRHDGTPAKLLVVD